VSLATDTMEQEATVSHISTSPVDLPALFLAHRKKVFRAAYRLTGNAADAEDVLQSVFLRLLGQAHMSDALVTDPAAYLTRSAINGALDVLRRRNTAVVVDFEVATRSLAADDTSTGEYELSNQQLQDQLRAALAKVNPRAAELFALKHFGGFGNTELAVMTETSASAVGVTLHRTRQQLQKHLGLLKADGVNNDR
jgi:RNA polymerase sigma-70 factor (ECF subfamily)